MGRSCLQLIYYINVSYPAISNKDIAVVWHNVFLWSCQRGRAGFYQIVTRAGSPTLRQELTSRSDVLY